MKLRTPSAPFKRIDPQGESITIETEGKVLVLPSGNPDILPLNNEYTLNSNRLSIAESPFGGLKGSGSPDYCVGTVNIIEGDGVYLQDVNGQNSSKTLSAGKLKELNLLTVDTTAHSITEEFIVRNTSVSNNPVVIDDCETVDNWDVQAGRGTITLETNDKISGSGAIKLTVGGAYSECYARLYKSISIASAQFICFYLKGPIGKTGQLYIYDSTGKEAYWNLGTYTGNWQRFVLPLSKPTYNSGINYNLVNALRFDIDNNPVQNDVLLIDNICGDVARPTYLEIQVPDYLADTSAQIYTHNGSAYQLCRTCKLDSAYASVSDTDANFTLANGTKFSDVYGTGNGRSVFPKGESGQSKNGSLTGSSITYSQNKGTLKRIGLRVDLPPAGTVAPNFSAVRLKVVTFYTDVQGNTVQDISGHGNNLVVLGTSSKSVDGIQFGTDGNYLYRSIAFPTVNINSDFEVIIKGIFASTTGTKRIFSHVVTNLTDVIALSLENGNLRFGLYNGSAYIKSKQIAFPSDLLNVPVTIRFGQISGSTYLYLNEIQGADGNGSNAVTDQGIWVGGGNRSTYGVNGKLSYLKISDANGVVAEYVLTSQNMGSTTYQFSDTTSASTGLQNLSKPWIALYDPAKTEIDFFLHTYRPKQLEFKKDESGNIHELKLFPGNGQIYHGRVTHCNPALDSDSNLIPNFLEESIEGSLTKFLKSYEMVI